MCGITGIISKEPKNILPILMRTLKNLEYRGYDSCGIATIINHGTLHVRKSAGKIDSFIDKYRILNIAASIGIAHTRWATHGEVNDRNAHPHTDCSNMIAVAHNGIIENFLELRDELLRKGHRFSSETDTEVIPHLLEHYYSISRDFLEALRLTVRRLTGTYAFVALTSHDPEKIFFAKRGQPLVIGINSDKIFLASDIPAFLEWTNKVIILRDGDIGYVDRNLRIYIENTIDEKLGSPKTTTIPWSPQLAKKGGFQHYMLKEIYEQPDAITRTLLMVPKQLKRPVELLENADRIYIVAAGTSFYASLYAQYLFAKYGIGSTAIISSEFPSILGKIVSPDDVILAISQSGETYDTLFAVRIAKKREAKIIGLVNVIGSSLMRESDESIVMGAGPEIGVAATKTFSCQVASIILILSELLKNRGIDYSEVLNELKKVPEILKNYLPSADKQAKELSKLIMRKTNMFYLGRGLGYPIALEGALKMKEIAYIHAESYPAGESKHGPIALIEKDFPVVEIVLQDENYKNMITSIEEMKVRGGLIIILHNEDDEKMKTLADVSIPVPRVHVDLSPLIFTAPLQLLAYHTAVGRGYDPDKPRNLAKSVTVA